MTKNLQLYPVQSQSEILHSFQELVHKELCGLHNAVSRSTDLDHPLPSNISHSHKIALRQLSSLNELVIRRANKGGTVVVLDIGLYIRENYLMLTDTATYLPLAGDPTLEFILIWAFYPQNK